MIGQMAIAIALSGFNDLGYSATLILLLMDHFLYQFSTFSENMNKIYGPFIEALRLAVRGFEMPLKG